ncbi:NUDIX domain-containing protein [Rhodoblastus sphagnicola]|uniref:GDP-mannose mannosyl hydrolase n=1 Tax=Rhodoblastus sphagnicola TaxID=333368 RepID=UPI001613FDDA
MLAQAWCLNVNDQKLHIRCSLSIMDTIHNPGSLPDGVFACVVRNAPLVAVDIIIRDPADKILVGLRANEPAKNTLFIPGGRIRKNETIRAAFSRILKAETGISASFDDAELAGTYEHFYNTNRFNDPSYGTHYVVLAFQLTLKVRPMIIMDSQHSAAKWMTTEEIMSASNVHPNSKAYFEAKLC